MLSPFQRLDEFEQYENGWNYGKGVAFDDKTIEAARFLSMMLSERKVHFQCFPGPEGQIRITVYNDNDSDFEYDVMGYTGELEDDTPQDKKGKAE